MADEQAQPPQTQPATGNPAPPVQLDEAFFASVNEYLELANKQARQLGPRRAGLASLFAAARFNAHANLLTVPPVQVAAQRKEFLDYVTTVFRRALNEHLDGMGVERGVDVGESELVSEYIAAGFGPKGPAAGRAPDAAQAE